MQHKVRLLASSALLIAAALGSQAHAQIKSATNAAAAAAAGGGGNTIEELVVTAEKRSQSLQDVPVAISAFTSERRELLGITSIQDMTNFTPGLEYTSANDRNAIRGVARLSNAQALSIPTAIYDDGIFTTSTVTAGKSPIFTDRVEVLRGPQGTLYGRNSLGGAINVISKHPTEDPYAEVRATIANYQHTLVEAAVSGPLAPNLQYRLAGNWEKQADGFYKNVIPGMPTEGNVIDTYYVEGQLQAKFGEHADGWIKAFITGWNNGSGGPGARAGYTNGPVSVAEYGATNINAGFGCAPGGAVTNVVGAALGCTNPANSDVRKFASNFAQTVSLDDTYGIAANFTYHFDGFDIKYIGGSLNYHYTLNSDNANSGAVQQFTVALLPIPLGPTTGSICNTTYVALGVCAPLTIHPQQYSTYEEVYNNFSDEIDISSSGNGPLQWIGGIYYYKQHVYQPVSTTEPLNTSLDGAVIPAVGPVARDFNRRIYDDRPTSQVQSYAAFGQIDWKFTDTLKLTLGLRYNHDEETGTESVRIVCYASGACGTAPELLGTIIPLNVDVTQSPAVTYQAGVPQGVVANGNPGGITFTPDGFGTRRYSQTWTATTGTAGIQWDPKPGTMMYARYSRGYLMGGFNFGITSSLGQFPETDPEYNDDIEIGMKKDFFNRTLQVNVALFHESLKNYQVPLSVVSNTGALAVSQSKYLNVPRAVSQGIEIESNWSPIHNMNILFNYSFDDAKITRLTGIIDGVDPEAQAAGAKPITGPIQTCTGTGTTVTATNPNPNPLCDVSTGLVQRPQDLSGNSMPQNARNKVAVAVTYTWDFEAGSLTPEVSYVWRDKQYSGIFERSYYASPSWDQTDIRLTWKGKDNRYTVTGFVKNLFDQLGYDGGAGAGRISGVYNASTIAALGMTPGLPNAAFPGAFNAVQRNATFNGISTTYPLTPPRTYGIEVQYRF
ncbi:MAG: TonB-dependent receptor [Proteobacteria bacterium]|nr:TonB-dependent receptor [Pseudomonadota bacterium]